METQYKNFGDFLHQKRIECKKTIESLQKFLMYQLLMLVILKMEPCKINISQMNNGLQQPLQVS